MFFLPNMLLPLLPPRAYFSPVPNHLTNNSLLLVTRSSKQA